MKGRRLQTLRISGIGDLARAGPSSVADRLAGFDVRQQAAAKPKYGELERRYRL
jgi:hypothetical protein